MASLYVTRLSTRKALYSKYYHVNELSNQWLCFGFSQCTVCLILALQRSKLPPSSGLCNGKVMTLFKHQFWLCCLVGLTGCLAVNNLTSWSEFTTHIQIIFGQSVCIKGSKSIQGQYLSDNSQHSSLRPFTYHFIQSADTTPLCSRGTGDRPLQYSAKQTTCNHTNSVSCV